VFLGSKEENFTSITYEFPCQLDAVFKSFPSRIHRGLVSWSQLTVDSKLLPRSYTYLMEALRLLQNPETDTAHLTAGSP